MAPKPSPCSTVKLIFLAPLLGILVASTGCQWVASSQNAQGTKLYEQGQYTAAMQRFQKVIDSDPEQRRRLLQLGRHDPSTGQSAGRHESDRAVRGLIQPMS